MAPTSGLSRHPIDPKHVKSGVDRPGVGCLGLLKAKIEPPKIGRRGNGPAHIMHLPSRRHGRRPLCSECAKGLLGQSRTLRPTSDWLGLCTDGTARCRPPPISIALYWGCLPLSPLCTRPPTYATQSSRPAHNCPLSLSPTLDELHLVAQAREGDGENHRAPNPFYFALRVSSFLLCGSTLLARGALALGGTRRPRAFDPQTRDIPLSVLGPPQAGARATGEHCPLRDSANAIPKAKV